MFADKHQKWRAMKWQLLFPECQLKEKDIPGAKLVKHPAECNLELKWLLENRVQKKSGKNVELIERVKVSWDLIFLS